MYVVCYSFLFFSLLRGKLNQWCESFPFLCGCNQHLFSDLESIIPGKAFLFFVKPFSLHSPPTWSFILCFLNRYHLFIWLCPPSHIWLVQKGLPDPCWVNESFFVDFWTWKQEEYLDSPSLVLKPWTWEDFVFGQMEKAISNKRLTWHIEGNKTRESENILMVLLLWRFNHSLVLGILVKYFLMKMFTWI